MTPEEAKRRGLMFVTEIQMSDGKLCGPIHMGFTGKETAEIAKAYASALHASEFNSADAAKDAAQWEKRFEEWSK